MAALRIVGIVLLVILGLAGGGVAWLALRSPAMRPAPTEIVERTPERIARGQYLVEHVADCAGCHSDHEWDRFDIPVKPGTFLQGGFPFGPEFGIPGVVCAQNLTPDPETGKAHWTDGEIMRAFREGVSRDGHALFPMMPQFRMMSDEDARSVVAFLRSIPAVHNVIPPSRIAFPVNLLIKFAPHPLEQPVAMPSDAADHLAYGKYLVQIAGCRDCHTPHDDHGNLLEGQDYSGGWMLPGPWGRVVSANITPDPDTFMGKATKEQFIARIKAYAGMKEIPLATKGRNTIMPWVGFSGMTEQDLGAIYDYIEKTVRPIHHLVDSFPDAAQ